MCEMSMGREAYWDSLIAEAGMGDMADMAIEQGMMQELDDPGGCLEAHYQQRVRYRPRRFLTAEDKADWVRKHATMADAYEARMRKMTLQEVLNQINPEGYCFDHS